ncbi:MAG: hypothetical protein FJX76_26505 [Armatimonadetes bacterium]|nr:hypothetical protein [Armatimonadota bacterium]
MEAHFGLRVLQLFQELGLIAWLGGLIYVSFVLPREGGALPPVFVRMLGLARFKVFGMASLGVLLLTMGILPLVVGENRASVVNILRLVILGACMVSTVQLYGDLDAALAKDPGNPIPSVVNEDPARVDRLLGHINNACRAQTVAGLVLVVLSVLA